MKILLIRHADQEYPLDDQGRRLISLPNSPLSKAGKKQAHSLAKELRTQVLTLNALYVSPYLRTTQTAKILQDDLSILNLEVVEDLREVDPTSAEGHTLDEVESIDGDLYSHPFGANQETLEHLIKRARSAFKYIESEASNHNFITIGIVSHGDLLCGLYWTLRNEGIPDSYAQMKKDYYPKKGEALELNYEDGLIRGNKRILTTEQVLSTIN